MENQEMNPLELPNEQPVTAVMGPAPTGSEPEPAIQTAETSDASTMYYTPVLSGKCKQCGAPLVAGEPCCRVCGTPVPAPQDAVLTANPPKKRMGLGIVIGAASAILLCALIFAGVALLRDLADKTAANANSGPDLQGLYVEYCSSTWANCGTDGSYLTIDTNPFDWEDDGLAYESAYDAIKYVNRALGLPESVLNDMGRTTALQGRQSETFPDLGVSVSWTYHPDHGLEVTYKRIAQ